MCGMNINSENAEKISIAKNGISIPFSVLLLQAMYILETFTFICSAQGCPLLSNNTMPECSLSKSDLFSAVR